MTIEKTIHIHAISDSTGETVQGLSKAVSVQFENAEIHSWTLIKTTAQMQQIIDELDKTCVVAYTVMDKNLISQLQEACKAKGIKCISPMRELRHAVKRTGGKKISNTIVGRQHAMDEEYFARVDALNFVVQQDDGQNPDNLLQSDVIILGVSRTSKSPTSIYLANKGIMASNVPFVNNIDLPEILNNIPADGPMVVGLTRDVESLVDIRRSRLQYLSADENSDYVNFDKVDEEIIALKRKCSMHGWPMINVSKKSIEETATQIIKYMDRQKAKRAQLLEKENLIEK